MNKIRTVFKFEVIRQLKKPTFWISLLLFPLGIVAMLGLSAINSGGIEDTVSNINFSNKKVGLTDDANLLSDEVIASTGIEFTKVKTEEAGRDMVKNSELDLYYYVSEDFAESHKVKIYDRAEDTGLFNFYSIPFASLLKLNVYQKLSPEEIVLVENTVDYETVDLDANGTQVSVLGQAIVPIAILGIFYILICVFGNRLTMALVEEKENRISEMILTSVSAKNLVIGKILSLVTLGFIQIIVFVIPVIAAVIIYRDSPMVAPYLAIIDLDPIRIIGNILLLLMSYFMFAGACMMVGSLMPTARDASQYIGIVMMGVVMPLFFINNFMTSDPNLVTYILSYFPLSSPIALMMRNAFGNLPPHELLLGIIELGVAAAFVMHLTVKSFQKNAINFSVVKPHFGPRKAWKK
ncbi:MAG: ABC transporter permease [Candidatus Saccharibacteria bacterium]|nr:ABC transporter permease [Candidatus Saccharibacteria bacterium]